MIGSLKFLLSLSVIASHSDVYLKVPGFPWFHHGVAAVIGFYLISGYFATHLIQKKYPLLQKQTVTKFFHDRFTRIGIQYYFYTFLTIIFLIASHYQTLNLSFAAIIAHLTILPLNLHQFFNISFFPNSDYAIIPPAWYLATLLQYYLIATFIIHRKKFRITVWIVSSITFILATFNIISTRYYGSRFLGVFIFFLIGDLLYRYHQSKQVQLRNLLFLIYSCFVILTVAVYKTHAIEFDYNGPVLLGFLFLFPIMYLLTQRPMKLSQWFKKVDRYLGDLSYAMYLNHFLILWILKYLRIYSSGSTSDNVHTLAIVAPTSVIFSVLTLFLERKITK